MSKLKYERDFATLTKKEMRKILAIRKLDDIKTIKLMNSWQDDHITCAGFRLNGVQMALWWCGEEIVGAIKYADESSRARKDLLTEIVNRILQDVDGDRMGYGTPNILMAFVFGAATPQELQEYLNAPFIKKCAKNAEGDLHYHFDEATLLTHEDEQVRKAAKKYFGR